MIELPPAVVAYLQSEFLSQARPYCFLIDEQYRLVETWGDGAWCGFDKLTPGEDVLRRAPYLFGSLDAVPQKLEHITAGEGRNVHLHTLPHNDDHYIVILDARHEHNLLQQRQQAAYEMRLGHRQQAKLIDRQRELIGELVETRSELDHHRQEVERSSENKSRFIAMMSHEFRTPLASIINYAELASDQDASGADVQKSIEAMSRSAHHLASLVEAVLDDARLEAGQIELQEHEFSLFDLLDDLAAMMAPLAAEKGLSFAMQAESDVPERLLADEVRLRQILINLLGNAVKYTTEGGVRLRASYNAGRLVATVSDTGPGISPEEQERVFQAFERGGRKDAKGAGLGLTITLRLAKLMHGEISLDSMPGEGCTVSLHVPAEEASAREASLTDALLPPTADTIATLRRSVLLCDDDEDMIALMEHYLHRSAYGLVITSDGADAIEKTMRLHPDLVLMDCNIPGISGIEAATRLRELGYAKPIVALTASQLSEADRKVFTMYFRKPAKMQDLLAAIKKLTH